MDATAAVWSLSKQPHQMQAGYFSFAVFILGCMLFGSSQRSAHLQLSLKFFICGQSSQTDQHPAAKFQVLLCMAAFVLRAGHCWK